MFDNIKKNYILFIILLLGTFLRFYNLDFQSVWLDEIHTLVEANSSLSVSGVYNEVLRGEQIPPHYFIVVNFLFKIFGYTPFVVRFLSVILGVLGIYSIYLLIKQFGFKKEALIAAFLVSINYFHIYYSQEARPYTMLFLFTNLSFVYLIKSIKNITWKNTLLYGLTAGLMIGSHLFGMFVLFSQLVILLAVFIIEKGFLNKSTLIKFLGSGVLIILLFLPSLDVVLKSSEMTSFWVTQNLPDAFTVIFKDLFANSEFLFSLFLIFVILYILRVSKINQKISIQNNELFLFSVVMIWMFFLILIPLLRSYISVPMLINRYFISLLPALLIIASFGLAFIKNTLVRGTLITIFVFFSMTDLIVIKNYYLKPTKSQFRESSAFVLSKVGKNEKVVSSLPNYFNYFFQKSNIKLIDSNLDAFVSTQDTTKVESFWYIDAHGRTFSPTIETQNRLEKYYFLEDNFEGHDAWARHYISIKDAPKTVDISAFDLSKESDGDTFKKNIEVFEVTNNTIKASGWAHFEDQASTSTKVFLILIKDNLASLIPSEKVNRKDITIVNGNKYDMDNSGFNALFNTSLMDSGNYNFALVLIDKETNKKGIYISNHVFVKN
jgi:mannosyltransferase